MDPPPIKRRKVDGRRLPFQKRKAVVKPRALRHRFARVVAEALASEIEVQNQPDPETDEEIGYHGDDEYLSEDEWQPCHNFPRMELGLGEETIYPDEEETEANQHYSDTDDHFRSSEGGSSCPESSEDSSEFSNEGYDPYTSSDSEESQMDSDPEYANQFLHFDDTELTEQDLYHLLLSDSKEKGLRELCDFFADFVRTKNITGSAGDYLLKGLKSLKYQNGFFDKLPRDIRTFTKPLRKVFVEKRANGSYYHFGLAKGISSRISHTPIQPVIEILINVDGLPIFKSSRLEFWPILGLLRGDVTPFPIGVWLGEGKPSCPNVYLRDFVEEAKALQQSGFLHRGRIVPVTIVGFSCDAPARSFITGTKSHTAKNACPRCRTVGIYYRKPGKRGGRETFPDLNAPLRTHESFLLQSDRDYHHLRSILEELNLDMILSLPFDYMHLACLGVMKKLLSHWLKRETEQHRITHEAVAELTRRLVALRRFITFEFARKPRPLEELPRWKATELRQVLLYTGPIILKGVLPDALYEHFMVFHVAMKILSSAATCHKYNTYSEMLLRHFVRECPKLYGGHFITFNVHCLIHLPKDVLRFGPLDLFSCFPFENFLYTIKKLIRNARNPLAQLVNRLTESSNCAIRLFHPSLILFTPVPILSRPYHDGPLTEDHIGNVDQFKTLIYKNWRITISSPNNCVMLCDGTIVVIENIVEDLNGTVNIIGAFFERERSFFTEPCDSDSILSIKSVSQISQSLNSWPVEEITCKVEILPDFADSLIDEMDEGDYDSFVVYPLLRENKFL